jgi:hypothetical protein
MTQSPRKPERSSQGKPTSSPDKSAKQGKEGRELEDADLSRIAGGVRSNGPIMN